MLTSSLQLAGDLLFRGSARDALNFVNEAKNLADVTGSPYWSAKVACAAAEVHIALRQYEEAASSVEQSAQVLSEVSAIVRQRPIRTVLILTQNMQLGGPESAEAHRILAELQSRQITTEEDSEMIEAAEQAFEATKQVLLRLEGSFATSDHLAGTYVQPCRDFLTLEAGLTLLPALVL